MSKADSKERIQFAKNLVVKASGRGHVTVRVRGTAIDVYKAMDPDLKTKIQDMPYDEHIKPWQDAMKKLEEEAIEEAKWEFRKL